MTLKRRVMVALVSLVALFTLAQGLLAVWSMHEQEDDLVDGMVMTEARRLAQRIEANGPAVLSEGGPLLLPDHVEAWWHGADGRTLPRPAPPEIARLANGPHRESTADSQLHILVMPVAGGRLFVRYDAARNEDKVQDFAWQVLMLAGLFIGVAALIARYVADLLVAPLERVAVLMDHWAPAMQPASTRPPAEEARLLDAFERVQTRWEHGLARENEMLANLHHEVRTPLAALRTDLEMLLDMPGLADGPHARRLQRAMRSVDAVAGALEAVRALRDGHAARPEAVPLADCVEDAWASLGELPAAHGLVLLNEVDGQAQVQADRQALMTILRNLMRNAAEHAAPARCRVAWEDGGLAVEDDGSGIADDELANVFERYYRGRRADAPSDDPAAAADTRGLGLAIARQTAELHGWQLSVRHAPVRGTRFELRLGAAPGA